MSLALMARVAELEKRVTLLADTLIETRNHLIDSNERIADLMARECSCTKRKART